MNVKERELFFFEIIALVIIEGTEDKDIYVSKTLN
jgi:hypothetical protein